MQRKPSKACLEGAVSGVERIVRRRMDFMDLERDSHRGCQSICVEAAACQYGCVLAMGFGEGGCCN